MKKILSVWIFMFVFTACSSPATAVPVVNQPSPAPVTEAQIVEAATPVCIAFEPTQADIDRALGFTGKLFDTPDWERTYTVASDKVSVTWYSETLTAIVFLEALIFPCGYEEIDLDNFFSDESWDIVLGNYQSYEAIDECYTDNGQRLYQFIATDQVDYDVHYWAVNDTDTRVISLMTVFPIESDILIDQYSYSLFPQISSC